MTSTSDPGPVPASSRWTLGVLMMVVFLNQVGFGVVFPLQPFYAKVFDAPPWQITLMFAVFSLGQFVGELNWGRLSDRIGRRTVLLVTLVISSLGYIAFAYAPTIWVAIIVRGVAGVFAGNMSVIQAYVVDTSPPERLAQRIGLIGMAFALGLVLGPTLGGLLVHPGGGAGGYRLPLLVSGALSGLTAIGVMIFVREVRGQRRQPEQVAPGLLASLDTSFRDPVTRRLILSTFFSFLGMSSLWSTSGLWGEVRFGWGPREVGLALAGAGGFGAVAQGLSGLAVRRLGEVRTIVGGFSFTSLLLLGVALSQHTFWAIASMCVGGLGHAIAQPSTTALISRAMPPESQGSALGANMAGAALGRTAGPLMAGALYTGLGPLTPVYLASALMLPAAWLAFGAGQELARRRRRL